MLLLNFDANNAIDNCKLKYGKAGMDVSYKIIPDLVMTVAKACTGYEIQR